MQRIKGENDPLGLRGKKRRKRLVSTLVVGALATSLWYVDSQVRIGEQRRELAFSTQELTAKPPRSCFDFKVLSVTIFLSVASGTSWTVPADCILLDTVDCIAAGGAGGSGVAGVTAGSGGSGGAWARSVNIAVSPNSSVPMSVGTGGAPGVPANNGLDTWFNATSRLNAVANGPTISCAAEQGFAGNQTGTPGPAGGQASNSVGTSKFSGGQGQGTNNGSGGGGGGAAGPNGDGLVGASPPSGAGGAGGAGDNGSGGAGGAIPAGIGGNGTEFDATHGSGGGGGGARFTPTQAGGNAGDQGAGGGGGTSVGNAGGGSGSSGMIRLVYRPFTFQQFAAWDSGTGFKTEIVSY